MKQIILNFVSSTLDHFFFLFQSGSAYLSIMLIIYRFFNEATSLHIHPYSFMNISMCFITLPAQFMYTRTPADVFSCKIFITF